MHNTLRHLITLWTILIKFCKKNHAKGSYSSTMFVKLRSPNLFWGSANSEVKDGSENMHTRVNNNPSAWNFPSPKPEMTCGTVAIVIRVVLLSPYLRIRAVSLSSIHFWRKAFPIQVWTGSESYRRMGFPGFLDRGHMKVERLLSLRTGHLYPFEKLLGVRIWNKMKCFKHYQRTWLPKILLMAHKVWRWYKALWQKLCGRRNIIWRDWTAHRGLWSRYFDLSLIGSGFRNRRPLLRCIENCLHSPIF